MKSKTKITVHAVHKGKIVSSCTNTLEGYKTMAELVYPIGYVTTGVALLASQQHGLDMAMVDCSFSVEVRHLYDGHL